MVFNSQTWAEPEVTKAAPEELAEQQSRPPIAGAYLAGPTGTPTAEYHPDPAVNYRPPRQDPYALGVSIRNGNVAATARSVTHHAPGETVTAMVSPAITKAGTSGSDTPLAPLRHATRPGQGRHPTGRFSEGEGVAAGHPSLDASPKPLSGGGGPQNAQRSEPGANASGRGTFDNIPRPEPLPLTVPVSRLDLRSPAGLLGGIVREPDPTPVSRPSATLDPAACGTSGSTAVPQHPRGAFMNAPDGPLAAAVRSHMNSPAAFGVTPSAATGRAPGEA